MYKQIIALLLVLVITNMMMSCAYLNYQCDPKKYRVVDYSHDENSDRPCLTYQNEKYFFDQTNFMFDVDYNKENFVELGWFYNLPHTVYKDFISYTTESPNYIFYLGVDCEVWFKESFDYTREVFVVEDAEIEFHFSEAFSQNTIDISKIKKDYQTFRWYSKTCSGLYMDVMVYLHDGKSYMHIFNMDGDNAYQISDAFLKLLIDNHVITCE